MLDEKAWLNIDVLVHPRGVRWGWVRALCRPLVFLLTKLIKPRLYWPCFVRRDTVVLKQEPASPSCCHKVGGIYLSKMSWYAVTLMLCFTGTEGPSPNPEKQPQPIIPHTPNFTVVAMHYADSEA